MIRLYDAERGTQLGTLSEEQFHFLVDQLEEESPTDQDYYISSETIDMLADEGADPGLVTLLRQALGDREGIDIRWQRE